MGIAKADGEVVRLNNGGENPRRRAHVLIIPFEEQGHYTVFLQLLYFLSSFDIVVTFCTSERRVKQLRQLLSEGAFKSLDLRLVLLSDDVSNTADKAGAIPPLWDIAKIMKVQFQDYRKKLASETDPNAKPTCLVADLFLDWSDELAEELQIPRYLIFTTAGWFPYVALKVEVEGAQEIGPDKIVEVPGRFKAPAKEIPSIIFPLMKLRNLAGILINTFEEVEGEKALEAVRGYLQHMTTKPGSKVALFLPVGPMVHIPGYLSSVSTNGGAPKSKALEWLDKQTPSSVVYVAFGTMASIPPALIYELARGLELSGVPFLWILRHSNSHSDDASNVHSLVPSGFMDRIKTQGYVETGWAPQLEILHHPSTGAFMSHCGWNSSMESISSGVPVLTWHMHGDQPLNARFIVDGLKVGLRVRKEGSTELVVQGEEVAASIKSLMIDDKGKELRQNSFRFKELALGSMQDGGSSHRNLHQFIDEILTN